MSTICPIPSTFSAFLLDPEEPPPTDMDKRDVRSPLGANGIIVSIPGYGQWVDRVKRQRRGRVRLKKLWKENPPPDEPPEPSRNATHSLSLS